MLFLCASAPDLMCENQDGDFVRNPKGGEVRMTRFDWRRHEGFCTLCSLHEFGLAWSIIVANL
jgi:hypothetical protein